MTIGVANALLGMALGLFTSAFARSEFQAVLPEAMTEYRKRQARWVGVAGAGAGLVVVGAVGGYLPWAGLLILVLALAGSARTRREGRVQVRQRRNADHVIVLRAQPAFDEQAASCTSPRSHVPVPDRRFPLRGRRVPEPISD